MQDIFVDVLIEIPMDEYRMLRDPEQVIVDRSREAADELCHNAGAGARLRTDRMPEFQVSQGEHRLTREAAVLVASRWAVIAPDAIVPTRPHEMRPHGA